MKEGKYQIDLKDVDLDHLTGQTLAFILTSAITIVPAIILMLFYPSRVIGTVVMAITVLTIAFFAWNRWRGEPMEQEKYAIVTLFYLLAAMQFRISSSLLVISIIGIVAGVGIIAMYGDSKVTRISMILGLIIINTGYFVGDRILMGLGIEFLIMLNLYYILITLGLGKVNAFQGILVDEIKKRVKDSNDKEKRIQELLIQVQQTTDTVDSIGKTVKSNMGNIDEASNHITKSIEGCTQDIIKETQSVHEVNQFLDEINGYLQTVVESSDDMLNHSNLTKVTVEEGFEKAKYLFENMDEVNMASARTQQTMQELKQQMDDVDTIVQTISRISNQTNLLSFNASIESARVGEHGKGFAVVANNIRTLANQSKEATMDIAAILERFRELIDLVNENMKVEQKNVKESQESKEIVEKVFDEMGQTVIKMANQTKLVREKLNELTILGIDIDNNMKAIEEMTTNNSSAMQEIMARIEEQTASISDVNADIIALEELTHSLNIKVNEG